MLPYCWSHVVFHTSRLFPRAHRCGIALLLLLLTAAVVFVPFWVLLRPSSTNYCNNDLFSFCVVSCAFTILSAGFSIYFLFRDPVAGPIRTLFHVFGLVCFLLNTWTFLLVRNSPLCAETTPTLYDFLNISSIVGIVLSVVTAVLSIFWVKERLDPHSVLDFRRQTGVCYDAYSVCPCVWHV
eukprot:m.112107 g.112107  ORF g.112107 m.112107 type:complete len:182 (-) comp12777_c0_seq2:1919-2464(-)